MRFFRGLILVVLAILSVAVHPGWGQQQDLSEVYLVWLPDKPDSDYAEATFSSKVAVKPHDLSATFQEPDTNGVTVVAKPSNTGLAIKSVKFRGGSETKVIIELDPNVASPKTDDTEVEVGFIQVKFQGGATKDQVKKTGEIYSRTNISKLKEKRLQEVKDAAAATKTSEEKNVFTGFNFATPSKGNSEGNGEVHLNHLTPPFLVSLHLRKSSAEKADPKQFDVALAYRKAFTTVGREINKIMKEIADIEQASDPKMNVEQLKRNRDKLIADIQNLQKKWILGFFIDAAGHIEGEAMNFNVTNAIFDLPIQMSSRTKNILNDNAYFNLRLIVGTELGRNLRSENDMMKKYYIGRFKYGGTLSFVYDPKDKEKAFPKRVELSLQAVGRYLFRNETAFDQDKKMAFGISEGQKPWYQADLKVYLSDTPQGRLAFRVSRIRGMLPPTFSDTRAFTYGVVFETADDKHSK